MLKIYNKNSENILVTLDNGTPILSLPEIRCKCNQNRCYHVPVSTVLLDLFKKLRELTGVPILVSSGYRCPTHNLIVGGSNTSQHLLGLALDLVIPEGLTKENFAALCVQAGFSFVKVYDDKNIVHVDVRGLD